MESVEKKEINFGYTDLYLCSNGPPMKPGAVSTTAMSASFRLDEDVTSLFPYINAIAERAELYPKPYSIRFILDNYVCMLHPEYGVASPFEDRSQAEEFMILLLEFLKDIYFRQHEIIPNHRIFNRVSVLEILKLLPQTNCRECGLSSCMAFAAMLSIQQAAPTNCPYLGLPMVQQAVYPVFDDAGRVKSAVMIEINPGNVYKEQFRNKTVKKTQANLQVMEDPNSSLPSPLTNRELEVLRMVAHGFTNMQISHELQISPHTVKSHIIHIFNKLGVNDRTLAAVWAVNHNLV